MNTNFDSINTEHQKCGCVISSNLDIINNLISDIAIVLCTKHYKKCKNKKEYSFNKNKSTYTLNSFLSNSILKKNIIKSPSFEKLNKRDKSGIILFGKYKYKTFDYVYNNDKFYCYNLSFWNANIYNKNENIHEFINFIKDSTLLV